jgi:hypothetical protein
MQMVGWHRTHLPRWLVLPGSAIINVHGIPVPLHAEQIMFLLAIRRELCHALALFVRYRVTTHQ